MKGIDPLGSPKCAREGSRYRTKTPGFLQQVAVSPG